MPEQYPRTICLRLVVQSDGKLQMKKVWEEDQAGNIKSENSAAGVLPNPLNKTINGHNAIGVLVSNPTCFIVGGQMICI